MPKNNNDARCLDCGKGYKSFGVDIVLPRSQWLLIHPDDNGLLCAQCIVNRIAKIDTAIVVHANVEFDSKNKYKNLEKQVVELLSVTGCGNVLDAIEYVKALQSK